MDNLVLKADDRAQFEGADIEIFHVNREHWLLGSQIVTAVGMSASALKMIFKRNRSEFKKDMTAIVIVDTAAGPRQARIFSPRGAALIAMLTKSPKAAAFRAQVLDVLEGKAAAPLAGTPTPPLPHQGGGGALVEALQAEVLRGNPAWRRIARYRGLGLSMSEVARLLGLEKSTIRGHVRRMEACGLLRPPAGLARMRGMATHLRLVEPATEA